MPLACLTHPWRCALCRLPCLVLQYASWNGLKSPDDFYTSPAVRQAYKAHLDFMINRANTVNGRTYR